jgi:hypothetical protein
MTRDFVKAALLAVLGWLDNASSLTPTKIDDAAVDVGRAIVEEELLFDWFFGKVTADDGALSIEAGAPEALQAVLARRNIDWAKLAEVAGTLITLIRMFRG